MPKFDPMTVLARQGSTYPAPFNELASERVKRALGNAGGLTDFGVNLVHLPPGAWSSQRHWHLREDEFIYLLSGVLTLYTDAGEEIVRAGECVCFPKNSGDGHNFVNRGTEMAIFLEVGTRTGDDIATYPDIDMLTDKRKGYLHKDGTPYSKSGG